jgi:uncharacterized membrane protein YgcG
MHKRLRLLKGANALLYFGPLLAGLGGFGWPVVPVFVVIFMLWLVILKPQEWPRSMAEWSQPETLVALAARGAVQLLLVLVSFGIGRGLGGVTGALPNLPTMLPIAISFLSIPLARLIWDPWTMTQIATSETAAAAPETPAATAPEAEPDANPAARKEDDPAAPVVVPVVVPLADDDRPAPAQDDAALDDAVKSDAPDSSGDSGDGGGGDSGGDSGGGGGSGD